MELTPREVDTIHAVLFEIRRKAGSKKVPRYSIENLCDRASVVLKKAARRRNKVTRLVFTQDDIEL